jgi:hypothetical protein
MGLQPPVARQGAASPWGLAASVTVSPTRVILHVFLMEAVK